MNFFRRNIGGGGGGQSNNVGGGGSADNLISTSSNRHHIDNSFVQNKFGSASLTPSIMTSDFSTNSAFDQKDDLARNCREFYERRVRMAEIASQRWGEKGNKLSNNLVHQGQTSPNSLSGEPMIIGTSDVTSSISSSSRDDSSSSYKESSANSSDHESSSHSVLPMLPQASSSMSSSVTAVGDKLKNIQEASGDLFDEKPFLKCATLPNRKSSSTKKQEMRTSTMLKKRKGSSSAGSIVTDEDDEEISHVHSHSSSSGSESCSDKLMMSTGCDESGIGESVAGRTSSSSGCTSITSGGLFDPETLPNKIADLRKDLLSLITLDNELFKNLLTINDTIEEMREQRLASNNHLQVLSSGGLENPLRSGNFILNGGRHHKRSKSNGKSSKSNSTSKFYETNTDEVGSMKNEGGRSTFFEVYENQQKSLTILNDEDEDEDQDKFNGNEFLSIGSEYFSTNKRLSSASNDNNEDASEPYDLRYHHTFASLPVDQSHFSTSSRNSKISSASRRTSSSSNDNRTNGSGNSQGSSSSSSIATFDGLAKFMLRSRSFLLRPSRSSSKAISMPPSFPSTQNETLNGNENANIFNKNNGAATNENKRRISYPLNRSNTNNTSIISEGQAMAKAFSNSGGSKIPIKIGGSRSRSRSRDGKISASNKHGPQSLPFHILQSTSSEADDNSHPEIIDEVELDDSSIRIHEQSTNQTVRHISTMPRQHTQKGLGGSKGRKLSQPNSSGKIHSESKKSLNLSSVNRYENNDNQVNRKSLSSNRSGSTSNNIGSSKANGMSQGSNQTHHPKYSSLTLEREKPRNSTSLNHRTTSYQRPLFHLPHQTRSKHLWQKVFVQATTGENGNSETDGNSFHVTSETVDSSIIADNSDTNNANITTKHVKQNSFDSGIADAAHSFTSTKAGNLGVPGVMPD